MLAMEVRDVSHGTHHVISPSRPSPAFRTASDKSLAWRPGNEAAQHPLYTQYQTDQSHYTFLGHLHTHHRHKQIPTADLMYCRGGGISNQLWVLSQPGQASQPICRSIFTYSAHFVKAPLSYAIPWQPSTIASTTTPQIFRDPLGPNQPQCTHFKLGNHNLNSSGVLL